MNIQGRLKKLETSAGNPAICRCKNFYSETYQQDLTEDTETIEPRLLGEAVPDICPHCQKSIEKQVFILQLVDSDSAKNYPEEMKDATTFDLKS